MIVIDEYLAVRVVGGDWPARLPEDDLGLPASRHWRLLQAVHNPRGGQLTQPVAGLSPAAATPSATRTPKSSRSSRSSTPGPSSTRAAAIAARYAAPAG